MLKYFANSQFAKPGMVKSFCFSMSADMRDVLEDAPPENCTRAATKPCNEQFDSIPHIGKFVGLGMAFARSNTFTFYADGRDLVDAAEGEEGEDENVESGEGGLDDKSVGSGGGDGDVGDAQMDLLNFAQ